MKKPRRSNQWGGKAVIGRTNWSYRVTMVKHYTRVFNVRLLSFSQF
jgi:hypothetical protein